MAPPLVRKFVRRHEIKPIDVVGLLQTLDKSDILRKRNSIGERLRELSVTWKFKNAELVELIRTKVLLVIVQASFGERPSSCPD